MILPTEPSTDQLAILPWRGELWVNVPGGHARWVSFGVSKSVRQGRWAALASRDWLPPFTSDMAKIWLADPCTMILEQSLRRAQLLEDEAEKAWKAKRREERGKLAEIERTAKKGKTRRSRW